MRLTGLDNLDEKIDELLQPLTDKIKELGQYVEAELRPLVMRMFEVIGSVSTSAELLEKLSATLDAIDSGLDDCRSKIEWYAPVRD